MAGLTQSRSFPLRLPVRYCLDGETRWRSGRTERISGSRALVRPRSRAMTTGPVRFVISLPSAGARPGGCLVGSGSILQAAATRPAGRRGVFAIAVQRCRLVRADRAVPKRPR
jgi:hypothetical protein